MTSSAAGRRSTSTGLLRWTKTTPTEPLFLHKIDRITPKSIIALLRKLQNHWHFRPMVVSEAVYNNIRTIEARRIRPALADGYEETSLADTTTESPHCRCTMVSTGTTLLRASVSASCNQGPEGNTAVQESSRLDQVLIGGRFRRQQRCRTLHNALASRCD